MVEELGLQRRIGVPTVPQDAEFWAPIQADYDNHEIPLTEVCRRHQVTRSQLLYYASHHGWVMRRPTTVVDRPRIIVRMFKVLERQVLDLEKEMSEMAAAKGRSGEREAALLGRLAGNLEKLVALDLKLTPAEPKRRSTKEMQTIRQKLIERIEQLKRT